MKASRPLIPVSAVKPPKYPTREQVLLRPSILCTAPRRWTKQPMVCAALLFTVASGLAGCSGSADSASAPSIASGSVPPAAASGIPGETTAPETAPSAALAPEVTPSATSTPDPDLLDTAIPVFEHGTGRGSYGCVSVAPPVFLSEEEALQVIQEEAAAQGVMFTERKTISGTFPATNITPDTGQPATAPGTYEGELELDGYDAALKIGVEFVSQQDVADWYQPQDGMAASVEEFKMLDTAQRLNEAAPGVAVFYDPTSDDWQEFGDVYNYQEADYVAAQKEKSIEDLRAQVRDFLQWLAAQGVI